MPALSTALSDQVQRWAALWREARARRRELRDVDPGLLERSLRDAGMTSVDFRSTRLGARRELERMEQHFGIDPARVPPGFLAPLRDAERVCGFCRDVRRCRRWSAQPHAGDDPWRFCPNASVFGEMAAALCRREARLTGPSPSDEVGA